MKIYHGENYGIGSLGTLRQPGGEGSKSCKSRKMASFLKNRGSVLRVCWFLLLAD